MGEIEVLMTSLIDQQAYPPTEFAALYFKRWGIETLYDRLKNRLALENFSGKTPEAVKQDFYSTILVTNLESLATVEVNQELEQKSAHNRYAQIFAGMIYVTLGQCGKS